MGETSYQIERHIRETRNDLGDNFTQLEEKVKTAMDWRAQFEERPMTMIAVAFGGGLLLSALLPSGRPSRRSDSTSRWSPASDRDSGSSVAYASPDNKPNQALDTVNAVKSALLGAALTKLSGYIEDVLPGFKQELGKTDAGKKLDQTLSSASAPPSWSKANAAGAD